MMITRRDFGTLSLKTTAAVAMAGALDQPRARAAVPAFRLEHGWGRTPAGFHFGLTHGVAVDRHDFVYVAHAGNPKSSLKDCILVFNPDGEMVRSWGAEFAGGAHGLDIFTEPGGEEVLFLTDLNQGLFKMTLQGELIWRVPRPRFFDGKDLKYRPSNVAVAEDGTVYLADGYGSYYITAFDRHGNELHTFAGPGNHERGRTFHPHGLWMERRPGQEPLLIVGENYYGPDIPDQGVLQRFKLDGTFHSYIETNHGLMAPRHFTSHQDILAIPDLNGRVTLLDANNQWLTHIGDIQLPRPEIRSMRTGDPALFPDQKFICPHDAAFDSKGNLFVVEWVPQGRITRIRSVPGIVQNSGKTL